LAEIEAEGIEVPVEYLNAYLSVIALIREREGLNITLGAICELVGEADSEDLIGLYSRMADMARHGGKRGKRAKLSEEKDSEVFVAMQKLFQERDASTYSADKVVVLIMSKFTERYIRIIAEQEKLITEYKQFLGGAEAEEYLTNVGELPAEALLEARGDGRTWSELTEDEKNHIRNLLKTFAEEKGYSVEEDEKSCIVVPKIS